jgi:hypothetical protein
MIISREWERSPAIAFILLATFVFPVAGTAVANSGLPTTLAELNDWYSEPPSGQNAAELVLRGASFVNTSSTRLISALPWFGDAKSPVLDQPVPASMKDAMTSFLRQSQTAFEYLRQVPDREMSRYPLDFKTGPDLLLPHLAKAQVASRYLAIYALNESCRNQPSKAGEALLENFGVTRSLAQEPCLISQFVRVAIIARAHESLEQVLNRVTLPSTALYKLDNLLQKLEQHDEAGVGMFRALVGDRLFSAALFDLPLEKGDITITTLLSQFDESERANITIENYPRAADKDFTDKLFTQVLERMTNSCLDRLRLIAKLSSEQQAVAKEKHYLIGYNITSGASGAVTREAGAIASLRIARIAIALERLRAITGNYPQTLSELRPVAADLNTQDAYNGEQLKYTKNSSGYLLTTCKSELPKTRQVSLQVAAQPTAKPDAK